MGTGASHNRQRGQLHRTGAKRTANQSEAMETVAAAAFLVCEGICSVRVSSQTL